MKRDGPVFGTFPYQIVQWMNRLTTEESKLNPDYLKHDGIKINALWLEWIKEKLVPLITPDMCLCCYWNIALKDFDFGKYFGMSMSYLYNNVHKSL